jgi:sugar lactone lactonase YvrE
MADRLTTTVAGGFRLPEGPRWHHGSLWFVDMLRGNVNKLTHGTVEVVASFDRPSSLGFLPDGTLLVVDGNKATLRTLRDGVVIESWDYSAIANSLNDMIIDRHGWAYIDAAAAPGPEPPRFGDWKADSRILLVKPGAEPQVVAEGILSANGIAISPDGRMLVVGESMGPGGSPEGARLLGYTVADDGSLSGERLVGTIARGSGDGLCFDAEGGLWVGASFGHEVQRFVNGEIVDRVPLTDRKWALACALGGPQMKTLFICSVAPPPKGDPALMTDGWVETTEVDVPGFTW